MPRADELGHQLFLHLAGGLLTFDCSCPTRDERAFCKHLVAVGLEVAGDDSDAWSGCG